MKLYHGGLIEVQTPQIIQGDQGRDFGFAFYTTDIKEQAERWACRRRKMARRNGDANAQAVVSVFEFDEKAAMSQLAVLDFPEASMEWLELVVACRSDLTFKHNKDIITGKIANDSVGETVAYVVAGVMRKEDALERLRFQKINNQVAFCSDRSLHFLKYECSYIIQMFEHNLIKATVTPEIIRLISKYHQIGENEALQRFYQSKTAENYADEETGLYGQSALHIVGLFIMEQDGTIDESRLQ